MAVQFDNKIFFHIPKTGGTYFRVCISELPVGTREIGHTHMTTPVRLLSLKRNMQWISIIRDPMQWYQSYYRYRIESLWRPEHHIDINCQSATFEEFVDKMLFYYPFGYVTMLYSMVIPFCDIILNTNDLTYQLKKHFINWGYKWNPNMNSQRPLSTTKIKESTIISNSLTKKFMECEKGAHELYKLYK